MTTTAAFSPKRLVRVREVLERNVDSGFVPGAVAAVARHGEVRIQATGTLAFEGAGSGTPMAADTICRIASTTKPIVAACAMTLVEDCTLRLDDPVDEFLPELADMRVLADPDGPLERPSGEPPGNAAGSARLYPRHRHRGGGTGDSPDRRRAECASERGARAGAGQ